MLLETKLCALSFLLKQERYEIYARLWFRSAYASLQSGQGPCLPLNYNDITKTYLYNFDPLKPYFYIVKLGFTGVLTSTHNLWFEQK